LPEQISLIAFACAFASLARKAFFTVLRQDFSCAVSAIALELQRSVESAARASASIVLETFRGTRMGVIYFLLPFADSAANRPNFQLLGCKFRLSDAEG
jgi:hypothetical protein